MKLQKEELSAVAAHILGEIRKKNSVSLLTKEEAELNKFIQQEEEDNSKIARLKDSIAARRYALNKKFNIVVSNYYSSGTIRSGIESDILRTRSKILPTLESIRQAIIMKSLFSNEQELKDFIKEIIAKY